MNCSATVAKKISEAFTGDALREYPNVDGVVAITHTTGCGMDINGEGMEVLRRTLSGYAQARQFLRYSHDRTRLRGQPGGGSFFHSKASEGSAFVLHDYPGIRRHRWRDTASASERIREMLTIANRVTRRDSLCRELDRWSCNAAARIAIPGSRRIRR